MELNREQIIKVLEHCSNWTAEKGCKGCPYDGNCIDEDVTRDALALIKQLTEEVASWKEIAEGYQKQFEDCAEDRAKLTEENERLRAALEQRPPKLIITKLLKKGNENV